MTTISMYKISVPIFVQFLTSLSAVLDKTAAYAEAKKVEPSVLLNTRLAPDMFPLGRQVRAATDHAINAGGRLAGVALPELPNADATIPELKDRIAKTIDFLKGLKPAQIDGSEDKEIKITFPSGAVREFTGQSLLLNNSLPNFYFHCTTAYDIARHCGIELGKRDFMGTPVSMLGASGQSGLGAATTRRPDRAEDYFDTTAVTSISTIIPGQASWLIVSSVWAGSGLLPNASTRHLP